MKKDENDEQISPGPSLSKRGIFRVGGERRAGFLPVVEVINGKREG